MYNMTQKKCHLVAVNIQRISYSSKSNSFTLSNGVIASIGRPHERTASDLRQLGCPRYVFMVSHTPVSRFSHTAIFKRVNKALYYSAEERARKSTGTVPTCHSVCGKPDKQERAGISSCQVRYLFINPAAMLKWFTEHLPWSSQVVIKTVCLASQGTERL